MDESCFRIVGNDYERMLCRLHGCFLPRDADDALTFGWLLWQQRRLRGFPSLAVLEQKLLNDSAIAFGITIELGRSE